MAKVKISKAAKNPDITIGENGVLIFHSNKTISVLDKSNDCQGSRLVKLKITMGNDIVNGSN